METCKDRFYIDIKRFLHSYYRRATQWNVSRSLFIRSKVVDIFVCRSQLQRQQSLAQLSPEFVFCYILQVNNSYTVILRPRARVARVSRVSLLLRSRFITPVDSETSVQSTGKLFMLKSYRTCNEFLKLLYKCAWTSEICWRCVWTRPPQFASRTRE